MENLRALFRPIILLGLLLALLPTVALAEGPLSGGTRVYVDREPVGPFTVSSFAAPNPPIITDNLWVTVQVRDGAKAVTDAEVWVTVASREGTDESRARAEHSLAASDLDYTAFLTVPTAGTYDVRVEIEHPSGTAQVQYTVNVSEPLTGFIFAAVGVPFLLVAGWLVWHLGFRKPKEGAEPAPAPSAMTGRAGLSRPLSATARATSESGWQDIVMGLAIGTIILLAFHLDHLLSSYSGWDDPAWWLHLLVDGGYILVYGGLAWMTIRGWRIWQARQR